MFLWKWLWQHLPHQPRWQFSLLDNLPNTWIYWAYNFPNMWIYWIVRYFPIWWVLHGISLWSNLHFLSTIKVENLFILFKNYLEKSVIKCISSLCHTACGILVLWPRIKPRPPALETWSLNHWTTGKVLRIFPYFSWLFIPISSSANS